jgi:hypothetical protein
MVRVGALLLGLWLAAACVTAANAQPADLLVSGQNSLVIIDGNGDGPGPGDCFFTATVDALNEVMIFGHQDAVTQFLACGEDFPGNGSTGQDTSSVFADLAISQTHSAQNPFVVEAVDEFGSGPRHDLPVVLSDAMDTVTLRDLISGLVMGEGTLCSANGPAALVTIPGGPPMLVQLFLFPNAANPMFLGIPNLFLSLEQGGKAFANAYVPMTDTMVELTRTDDSTPIVEVRLGALAACVRRGAAPAASEWVLMLMALALLLGGAWVIGRRQAFRESLPLP